MNYTLNTKLLGGKEMNTKLIPIVLTLVVGTILAGSVLMPVLNDATKTEGTFENHGYFSMDAVEENTDTTIRFDNTLSKAYVNGTEVSINSSTPNNFTILGADNFIVRWQPSTSVRIYSDDAKWSFATTDTFTFVEFKVGGSTVSITSDKTDQEAATISMGNTPFVISSNDNAEYVMKLANEGAYVTDESVCLMGISVGLGFNTAIGVYGIGTIADGMSLSTAYQGTSVTGDITYADPVADYSSVSGYNGLYKLNGYTSTITVGETTPTDISYTYFIVPAEVTAELSQHLTPGQIALMSAIPIMVIIALIMVAVGVVARRND